MAMAATAWSISPLPSRRNRLTISPIPLFGIHTTTLTTSLISFSSTTTSNSNNNAPQTDCPVPMEQQPINEYHSLSTSFPFSWAALDAVEYASRLFVTGTFFALLVGLPVAWFGSAGAQAEPLKRLLCAASSGLFAVTLAVVRMYLGWAYVGNRLLSATVECMYPPSLYCHTFEIFLAHVLFKLQNKQTKIKRHNSFRKHIFSLFAWCATL